MKQILEVIFEDERLLVLNKPPGMVVNRAESVFQPTVQDWLEERIVFPRVISVEDRIFRERSGLAHRIDKETSGILLVAKDPQYLQQLLRLFRERLVQKTYLALVHGILEPKEGFIRLPLGRNPFNRHKFKVDVDGKLAFTDYRVLQSFFYQPAMVDQDGYSLVEVMPHTGRTHQIRVHFLHLGHPLVGDELYLSKKRMNSDRAWCSRHFLHAQRVTFNDDLLNKKREFEAPLPHDLRLTLETLS